MISRTELNERVQEWGLREDVVEKDYVIGWLLWGIGSNARLSASWAFWIPKARQMKEMLDRLQPRDSSGFSWGATAS